MEIVDERKSRNSSSCSLSNSMGMSGAHEEGASVDPSLELGVCSVSCTLRSAYDQALCNVQLTEHTPSSSEGLSCDDLQTLPPTVM